MLAWESDGLHVLHWDGKVLSDITPVLPAGTTRPVESVDVDGDSTPELIVPVEPDGRDLEYRVFRVSGTTLSEFATWVRYRKICRSKATGLEEFVLVRGRRYWAGVTAQEGGEPGFSVREYSAGGVVRVLTTSKEPKWIDTSVYRSRGGRMLLVLEMGSCAIVGVE